MKVELGDLGGYQRPQAKRKLPVVLSPAEVDRLLAALPDMSGLMARIMYGTGMRLMECVRLRVKDIDWDNGYIDVVGGKGDKSRRVPLPDAYSHELEKHLAERKLQYEKDVATTMIYTHVLNRPGLGALSPADLRIPGARRG